MSNDKELNVKPKIVGRVKLGDNREVRVTKIPTGTTEDYIRIGINLIPGGENMSGAVFPASFVPDLIALLQKAS
jgi:hypothetical protein